MCIETTKNVSVQYSEKFVKEINKFFDWVNSNGYTIRDIEENITKEWNIELLKRFEEPGRNKIESYLKELTRIYVIIYEDQEVEDVKMIAKDFKLEKKNKKQEKKQKKENKKNSSYEKSSINIEVCTKYPEDWVMCPNLENILKVKWDKLKEKFGEPNIKTENLCDIDSNSECKYRYEWKIKIVNNNIISYYSIHDWVNKKGKFDDIEKCKWYISGYSVDKTDFENDIKTLTSFLKKKSNKSSNSSRESSESTCVSSLGDSLSGDVSCPYEMTNWIRWRNQKKNYLEMTQTVEIGELDIDLDDLKFE
jgi:hypothetical protein